jgi:hypothetical protein
MSSDFVKIDGSSQIQDNSIDISKLQTNFLNGKNWRINGEESKFISTITTIPYPYNNDDVANKYYVDSSILRQYSFITDICSDVHDSGYYFDKDGNFVKETTKLGIIANSDIVINVLPFVNTNNIEILLNDIVISNTDRLIFSEPKYIKDVNLKEFEYVTAKITIFKSDMVNGYNKICIRHSNLILTGYLDWIYDKDDYIPNLNIMISDIVVQEYKYLSGIKYATKAYFNLSYKVSNLFKYTVSDKENSIEYLCKNCNIENTKYDLSLIQSSNDDIVVNQNIFIDAEQILDDSASVQILFHRPSKEIIRSNVFETQPINFNRVIKSSTDNIENFDDEYYRLLDLDNIWDSTIPLINTPGLLIYNSTLIYPHNLSGNRTYYRKFKFNKNFQNFIIEIESENTSFISTKYDLNLNNLHIEVYFNGWKDITILYNGDISEIGCKAGIILDNLPTRWGFTFGIHYTAEIILRITASDNWSGYISKINLIGL